MQNAFRSVLLAAAILLLATCLTVRAQGRFVVVADFNEISNISNVGTGFGTWDKDPNDPTQGCRMSFVRNDAMGSKTGMSVRLEYDVDSPNPAYNGFWLKLDGVGVQNYRTISFYVLGDTVSGFATAIKVEIKDKKGGKTSSLVEHISDKWQKISLPLNTDKSVRLSLSEFTIVFDDQNSRPKRGAIMIDQIELSE